MKFVIVVLLTLSVLAQAQDKPAADQYVTLSQEAMTQKLKTIENKSLMLSDYPDAIIIINLFATWAAPSRMNLSDLIDLKKHYDKHPIVIIGMDLRENEPDMDRVIQFADEMKINFPGSVGHRQLQRRAGRRSQWPQCCAANIHHRYARQDSKTLQRL